MAKPTSVKWVSFDLVYRVAMGIAGGYFCGLLLSKFSYSAVGDANHQAENSLPMVLGGTLLAYGLTEAVDGYGFLAVFVAARAARRHELSVGMDNYKGHVHAAVDQLESLLLTLLLLWLGMFAASGMLNGITLFEVMVALALIILVRPLAGFASLIGYDCPQADRRKLAFFGIRGMGSIFYLAYAQNHGTFDGLDVIWRVTVVAIILSIIIHGFAARHLMPAE